MQEEKSSRFIKTYEELVADSGIGTLGEKALHATIKQYIEPNSQHREVKIDRFVADVYNENGIFEVQTAGFEKLATKLQTFLPNHKVTVVYPVPHIKWICWTDPITGQVSQRRKSNKKGQVYDILFELYRIRPFLQHENFNIKILLLEVEEYRLQDGWSKDGKKGSHRIERVPIRLVDEKDFCKEEDFYTFVPPHLSDVFTLKEYGKAIQRSGRIVNRASYVLQDLHVIQKAGKKGNAFLYQRTFVKEDNNT